MRTVISRIKGGLGNQLFCFAAAYRLAIKNNAELAIDDVSGFLFDTEYRRKFQLDKFNHKFRKATAKERMLPLDRIRRYLRKKINLLIPFKSRNYITQAGDYFDPRLLEIKIKEDASIYLDGYWQSEGYFKDVEVELKSILHLIPPTDSCNLEMAQKIKQHVSVAIHIRNFDYTSAINQGNVEGSFYCDAINLIDSMFPNAHYFIFSDYPEYAERITHNLIGRKTQVLNNNTADGAPIDMWLMAQCEHFIIANSTFSWWAAWLSQNPKKIIIAPSPHRLKAGSFWRAVGMLPMEWILI